MRGELGGAEKGLDSISRNDSELPEDSFVNLTGSGHSRGMCQGRDCTAFGLPDFENDNLFFQLVSAAGELEKTRAILQPFHQDGRYFRGFVFQEEFDEIAEIEIHLVAIAHEIAEALTAEQIGRAHV